MERSTPLHIILASASPRRRELLKALEVSFQVAPVDTVEDVARLRAGADPSEIVTTLALSKACTRMAWGLPPGPATKSTPWVLGADTLVVSPEGDIIGKPTDARNARKILQTLSGAWHEVVTGVALLSPRGDSLTFAERSQVRLGPFRPGELSGYLRSNAWRGKAGGYGIQDKPTLVREHRGSFSNIVGLPLETLRQNLCRL